MRNAVLSTLAQYLILAAIIGIAIYLKYLFSKFSKSKLNTYSDNQKIDPVHICLELEKLDFFKYADKKDLENLKINIFNKIPDGAQFYTEWNEDKGCSIDYREFLCDGESLFEIGGFDAILEDLKPYFKKSGLKMNCQKCIETSGPNDEINYKITINDKEYIIFENFVGYGWGEAAVKLVEILNDQLKLQNKEDRAYLENAGNDGSIIFLTEAQFRFLDKTFREEYSKPLPIDRWCKEMGVEIPK